MRDVPDKVSDSDLETLILPGRPNNCNFLVPNTIQSQQTPESSVLEVGLGDENKDTTQPEELSEEELRAKRINCCKKSAVTLVLVGFIAFVVADTLTNGYIRDGLESFLEWIEANIAEGIFVFTLVYFVATVLFVPGSILTLGAGFAFASAFGSLGVGVMLATVAVFFGASAGAIASFLLGRFILREWVSGFAKKYAIFEALDNAFEEKGFRIMTLLRLSPIIPFNAINYIAGVTAISFRDYFWALFGILPGTILFVFLGASAGSLADSANSGDNITVTIVVVVVGIVFGVIAIAATSYYAKKELQKVAAKRGAELDASREETDAETGVGDDSLVEGGIEDVNAL